VAAAVRCGLLNIGAEGQLYVAASATAWDSLKLGGMVIKDSPGAPAEYGWASLPAAVLIPLAVLTAVVASEEAVARPHKRAAGAELTAAELGWPDGAKSAQAKGQVKVWKKAGGRAREGKLSSRTRVAWKRSGRSKRIRLSSRRPSRREGWWRRVTVIAKGLSK
jgi:hypothetical protein